MEGKKGELISLSSSVLNIFILLLLRLDLLMLILIINHDVYKALSQILSPLDVYYNSNNNLQREKLTGNKG